MVTSQGNAGEFQAGAHDLRALVLSTASLTLRCVELGLGSVLSREAEKTAEVFDLHERIEEFGVRGTARGQQLLVETLCDELRFERVLTSVSLVRHLVHASGRSLEIASGSRILAGESECIAPHLLDPFGHVVCGLLRRAVTAYADEDLAAVEAVLADGEQLPAVAGEVVSQVRRRVHSRSGGGAAGLHLILVVRALSDVGRVAMAICEELHALFARAGRREGSEEPASPQAGIPS